MPRGRPAKATEAEPPANKRSRTTTTQSSRRKVARPDDDEYGDADSEDELDPSERRRLVSNAVRVLLQCDTNKHPIRRADITSRAFAKYKGSLSTKTTKSIIEDAYEILKDAFGFEVCECQRATKDPSKKKATTSGFILKNTVPESLREGVKWSDTDLTDKGLLITILSLILLNQLPLDRDSLYEQMALLGFSAKDANHPDHLDHAEVGSLEKALKKFCSEGYLTKNKVKGEKRVLFSPGPRSAHEITQESIFAFLATVFGEELDASLLKQLKLQYGSTNTTSTTAAQPPPQTTSTRQIAAQGH
ncbi:MAGE family protein [Pelomyxa schiedti]|nr:MAGE family protein [Pelomyxa schiedti]